MSPTVCGSPGACVGFGAGGARGAGVGGVGGGLLVVHRLVGHERQRGLVRLDVRLVLDECVPDVLLDAPGRLAGALVLVAGGT